MSDRRDTDRHRRDRSRDRRREDRDYSDRDRRREGRDYSDDLRHFRDRQRDRERRDRRDRRDDRRDRRENGPDDRDNRKRHREIDDEDDPEKQPATKDDLDFLASKRKKTGTTEDEKLTTKTGGAYIPPAKLRAMQASITDKSTEQFQRLAWEALKKSINGLVNKVNVSNIVNIVKELLQENIIRGRGMLSRAIIQAQAASPTFTHVYAALVSIINSKFPQIGELILKRLIIQFKRGYKRKNKDMCLSSVTFMAHLVNQQVAHEILALEVLTLLLEEPTDDSVEVSIGFLKECGAKLTEVSPKGIIAIFERLRHVLHEASIDKRVQYMIEVMFATRKDGFKDHPSVPEGLDLIEEDDQFTHMLTLDDAVNDERMLDIFKVDPDYEDAEEKYKVLKREILDEGDSDSESGGSGSGEGSDSSSDNDEDEEEANPGVIVDQTETNLVALRRTIYLTLQSSLDFEEAAHKVMKLQLKPGQEEELCNMVLDCCAQLRTYEKYYGLLAQRFCMIDKKYIGPFQEIFQLQYDTCHRLETNKLRNVAKFFAHLLHSDAVSWEILQHIKLNEDDTTSSSRIFIKVLFQELCEFMGLAKLNNRLNDETLRIYFEGLFPRDNPRDTRFAINFFTSIGLGGLTDGLRDHLKTKTKAVLKQQQEAAEEAQSSSDSSSSSSSDSDSDSSSSDSSSSSSSSSEDEKRKKRRKRKEKENSKTGKRDRPDQSEDRDAVKKKPTWTVERSSRSEKARRSEKEARRQQIQEELESTNKSLEDLKLRKRKKRDNRKESMDRDSDSEDEAHERPSRRKDQKESKKHDKGERRESKKHEKDERESKKYDKDEKKESRKYDKDRKKERRERRESSSEDEKSERKKKRKNKKKDVVNIELDSDRENDKRNDANDDIADAIADRYAGGEERRREKRKKKEKQRSRSRSRSASSERDTRRGSKKREENDKGRKERSNKRDRRRDLGSDGEMDTDERHKKDHRREKRNKSSDSESDEENDRRKEKRKNDKNIERDSPVREKIRSGSKRRTEESYSKREERREHKTSRR